MSTQHATAAPSFAELLATVATEPGILSKAFTRFHNYSLGNQLLAYCQCLERGIELGPMATYAAWQSMGRQVLKGSKAIVLCQPVTLRRETTDTVTGEPSVVAFTRFTYRPKWFVLAQTDGKPYEAPALPTWSQAKALEALNVALVPFDVPNGNVLGYATGRNIAVSPLAESPLAVAVHELAHIVLCHTADGDMSDGAKIARDLREAEAEGVTLLVLGTLNQPGLAECRGYIQHWLKGQEIPERNAQRIFKAADAIIRAGRSSAAIADADSLAENRAA